LRRIERVGWLLVFRSIFVRVESFWRGGKKVGLFFEEC